MSFGAIGRKTVKKILATSRTLMHLQSTRLMLALLVLAALVMLLGTHPAAAQETPAAQTTAAAEAPAAAEPAAAATEAAAPAAPVYDKGDIAWMLLSTLLVLMMAVPGLALFYGGMVRSKNVLSLSMQVFVTFSLLSVLWAIYGYSIAFTGGNAFFGGFDRTFLSGMLDAAGNLVAAATFSKGVYIPEYLFASFQMTFAGITACLIVGAFAERMKFSAVLLFMVLWFTFSYLPIAHMVWFWAGPDAYTDAGGGGSSGQDRGLPVPERRARFRRRHGRAHQRGHRRPGRLLAGRQAQRLRHASDGSAQRALHHDRRSAAVGRLVRLQRRLQSRSERVRGAGLHQHVPRDRRGGVHLDVRRVDLPRLRRRCSVQRPARSRAWWRSRRPAAGSARWARW